MDTEKLKQMGRDYFESLPVAEALPNHDPTLWSAWEKHMIKTNGLSNNDGSEWKKWSSAWREGFDIAKSSKEGRAIELLGRLFKHSNIYDADGDLRLAWSEAGEFLQEIRWKPNSQHNEETK